MRHLLALLTACCSISSSLASFDGQSSDSDSSLSIFRSSSPGPKEISPEDIKAKQKFIFQTRLKTLKGSYEEFFSDPTEQNYIYLHDQFKAVTAMYSEHEHLSDMASELEPWLAKMNPTTLTSALLDQLQKFYETYKDDTTDQNLGLLQRCFFTLEETFTSYATREDAKRIADWRERMERKEMIRRPGAVVSPRGNAPAKSPRNTSADPRVQPSKK